MDEDLDPRETARTRRRDHDAAAKERDLLRPGMGKVFKQITDSWSKEADADRTTRRDRGGRTKGRAGS